MTEAWRWTIKSRVLESSLFQSRARWRLVLPQQAAAFSGIFKFEFPWNEHRGFVKHSIWRVKLIPLMWLHVVVKKRLSRVSCDQRATSGSCIRLQSAAELTLEADFTPTGFSWNRRLTVYSKETSPRWIFMNGKYSLMFSIFLQLQVYPQLMLIFHKSQPFYSAIDFACCVWILLIFFIELNVRKTDTLSVCLCL